MMALQQSQNVSLPPSRAFVVQFRTDINVEARHYTGRVEHVTSGQAARFQSLDALLAFIARVLHEVNTSHPEAE